MALTRVFVNLGEQCRLAIGSIPVLKKHPVGCLVILMAGTTGIEPATSCVTGMHSNQLSYAPIHYSIFNFDRGSAG